MVYSYLELSQAVEEVGKSVNLWAVVLECSIPRPTRGSGALEAAFASWSCRRRGDDSDSSCRRRLAVLLSCMQI